MSRLPKVFAGLAAAAAAAFASAPPAHGFDGKREGFVLGFGGGYGNLWVDRGDGNTEGSGFATAMRIGAGLDDRTMLLFTSRQVWDIGGQGGDTQVLGLIGVTHHFAPASPGPFLAGGAGVSLLDGWIDDDITAGIVVMAGAGYEFARHWSVELDYLHSFDTGAEPIHTVTLTVAGLAY